MIEMNDVITGPSLSQTAPPNIFPATTNTVIRTVSAVPCFQEYSTTDPPIALTATAAESRTVENSASLLSSLPDNGSDLTGICFLLNGILLTAYIASITAKITPVCGNRVPNVSPMAPGATNTPRGQGFWLDSRVNIPPATWNPLFPRPIRNVRIIW